MNILHMFQECISEIMDDLHLSGSQQRQKMIQVFDLCHFIDTYNQPLKIVDYNYEINIVEHNGICKAIYFYDLQYSSRLFFGGEYYDHQSLLEMKRRFKLEELWFVTVVESNTSDGVADSVLFIQQHGIANLYDRIFYFNFSQSKIRTLK